MDFRNSSNPLLRQIPTDGYPKAPTADGSQDSPMNNEFARQARNTLAALPGAAAVPGAVGRGAGLASQAFGAATPAASMAGRAAQAVGPAAVPIGGLATISHLANAETPKPPAAPPPLPSPASVGAPPQSQPAAVPAPTSPAVSNPMLAASNITREGNSYSGGNIAGDVTINGQAPRNGGSISPQSLAASARMSDGYQQQVMAGLSAPQTQAAPSFRAPRVQHSGNSWEAEKRLRELEGDAKSITNQTRWGGEGSKSLASQAYMAAVNADLQARGMQPQMDAAAMRENAGLASTAMREDGSNRRSLYQYSLDQQRINQAGEAQGYTNRSNALIEAARNQMVQEQDPGKRQGLVQRLRELQGGQTADPYLVVPGGQQVDENGKAYNLASSVFNRQSGQFVRQPGAQGGNTAPPPARDSLVRGQVYQTRAGSMRWNGSAFESAN